MNKKPKVPKGSHRVREHVRKNPKPYKPLGKRIDDDLKEGLKKSGLW